MSRVTVLIDGHAKGHHCSFLKLFASTAIELPARVILVGPGAAATASSLKKEQREVEVIEIPEILFFLFKGLRLLGINRGSVFYLCAICWSRWRLRSVPNRDLVVFLPYVYAEEFSLASALVFRLLRSRWGALWSESRWCRHPERFPDETESAFAEKKSIGEAFFRNLRVARVRAMAVLDEAMVDFFALDAFGRVGIEIPAFRVPEILDRGEGCDEVAHKIREWSRDRKVVTALGALKRGKGLIAFCEVAETQPEGYCFLIGGEINWASFRREEVAFIQRVLLTNPQVVNFAIGRLEDRYFEGILEATDLLFLRYHNWTNSSNMLSHAVRRRVPVLVEEGFVLAERVERHRLGIVVAADDQAVLPDDKASIDRIRAEMDSAGYLREHGLEQLRDVFGNLVTTIESD